MLVNIKNGTLENLHKTLNLTFKTILKKNGYEYKTLISKNKINLSVESFQFGNGFNFTSIKGDLQQQLELEISEDTTNHLRFLIVRNGILIHMLSPSIRYRLNSSFSSTVVTKGINNQRITFPAQNNLEAFFLQVLNDTSVI